MPIYGVIETLRQNRMLALLGRLSYVYDEFCLVESELGNNRRIAVHEYFSIILRGNSLRYAFFGRRIEHEKGRWDFMRSRFGIYLPVSIAQFFPLSGIQIYLVSGSTQKCR
jgi:hypothetical protein